MRSRIASVTRTPLHSRRGARGGSARSWAGGCVARALSVGSVIRRNENDDGASTSTGSGSGHYRVIEMLSNVGDGTRGADTYRVARMEDGEIEREREYLAKVVSFPRSAHDWAHVDALRRECRILSSLRKNSGRFVPRVIEYFEQGYGAADAGGSGDTLFVLVLSTSGPKQYTLFHHMTARNMRFTEKELRALARGMLRALAYIEKQLPPVVHTGVSPFDVTLDEDGNVTLINFGMAHDALRRDRDATAAAAGEYTAPELLIGREATAKCDQYSAAATLLFVMSGRSPSSFVGVCIRDAIPMNRSFADMLERMLSPSPELRFEDARAALHFMSAKPKRKQSSTGAALSVRERGSRADGKLFSRRRSSSTDSDTSAPIDMDREKLVARNRRRISVSRDEGGTGNLAVDIRECAFSFDNLFLMGFSGAWNSIVLSFVGQAVRLRALPLVAFSVPFVLAGVAVTKAGFSGLLISHRILVSGVAIKIESRIARRTVRTVTINRNDFLGLALVEDGQLIMQEVAPSAAGFERDAIDVGSGGWLLSSDESVSSSSLLFVRRSGSDIEKLSLECDMPAECLEPVFESIAERLAA